MPFNKNILIILIGLFLVMVGFGITLPVPLASGVLYKWGIMLSPAAGAVLMSVSTIVVAINSKMLKVKQS